ncbi:MAG: EAL domain-containing protein [Azonexus sp.]|nr:EAL domain-containing protein [Azonexus sp.]MCK6413901.1 EAL domain-containing protein [Azonexus sp.]
MSETGTANNQKLELARRYLAWLIPAFLLLLSLFAMRNLVEKGQHLNNALGVHSWIRTSQAINRFVHEIQRERGLSSGYLASDGRVFGEELQQQQARSQQVLTELKRILEQQEEIPGDGLVGVQRDLRDLGLLRDAISTLRVSHEYAVDHYTGIIEQFFDLQIRFSSANADAALYRQQLALFNFMEAKEHTGRERALLSAMFSDLNFSVGRIESMQRLRAAEEVYRTAFLRLARADLLDDYGKLLALPANAQAQKIRQRAVAAGLRAMYGNEAAEALPLPAASEWFTTASVIIDAMKGFEDEMATALMTDAARLESSARRELFLNAFLTIVSFVLAAVLIEQLQRGRRAAEEQLDLADAVFLNSVESILVTDAELRIVEVNPAFTQFCGYSREEVLGQHPRLLCSGKHDAGFYRQMWQRIAINDHWEGEVWNRRKNGDIYPALLSIAAVRNRSGRITHYTGMIFDLSQHKKVEALMEQLRTFDGLTGLPNRDAWLSALDQAVANNQRSQGHFAILEVDLDRFKIINDSLGHLMGDKVLVEAAHRLRHGQRKQDIVARPGGNRFSILLYEVTDPQSIGTVCEKLLAGFSRPFDLGENCATHVTASIGIATYPNDGQDAKTLLMAAESALYSAKADGRNLYKFFSHEMNELGARMFKLERMLRQALDNAEFSLVYQPQVDAHSGRLVGVEALLRWNNPELGSVSPVQFIPVAEETGLIVPIGEWVMRTACRQAQTWRSELGLEIPVAVNLSARQFQRSDLLTSVQAVLDETGLPNRLLELEITEGLLMADPISAIDTIRGLHFMGVRTALDDFGTGYSSLAYLKLFPINRLKIDRAFVRDLPDNDSDRAISQTVIALGLNLKLEVLAEGVETEAQRDCLRDAGCQVFQGFLYSKPLAPETLVEQLRNGVLST